MPRCEPEKLQNLNSEILLLTKRKRVKLPSSAVELVAYRVPNEASSTLGTAEKTINETQQVQNAIGLL